MVENLSKNILPEFYNKFKQLGFQFTTDSRKLNKGDVYFALKGPNFNGNEFALKALEQGAEIAVVDDTDLPLQEGLILVDDVLKFLQDLARYHRDQFDIPVIAVGGSNGKTTTKELLLSVIGGEKKVHGTAGNLNNLIGVPITLLCMPLDTEIAVIEVGTNTFGEIAALCEIVNPNFGMITNIGKEHLEGFGDLEGVAREESELYHYLQRNGGLAFVNREDEWLMRMASRLDRTYTYGRHQDADCELECIQVMPDIRIELNNAIARTHLFGDYNLPNIAAAVCIARYFGISDSAVALGLDHYVPKNNRSEIRKFGDVTVIQDFYNANPSSMEAALTSFAMLKDHKKCIILGDMFELGERSEEEHRTIAQFASDLKFNEMILVGEQFSKQAPNVGAKGFTTTADALSYIRNGDFNDFWVLIKGSRGMKLEEILNAWDN